ANQRLNFDLHKHFRGNQAAHFDHGSSGANCAEEFAVCFTDFLPVVDVRDEYACANNIFQAGTRFGEGCVDVFEDLHGLCIWVSDADNLPVFVRGSRACHMNDVSYSHGTRIADDWFPGSTRGDILSLHRNFTSVVWFAWRYTSSSTTSAIPHRSCRWTRSRWRSERRRAYSDQHVFPVEHTVEDTVLRGPGL